MNGVSEMGQTDRCRTVKAQPLQCVSEAGNHLLDAEMGTKLSM